MSQLLQPIELCTKCREGEAAKAILWDCLPVPCFGNPDRGKVRVVTLSLNPSSLEFYDEKGQCRPVGDRLPMVQDFGAGDRSNLTPVALGRAREIRDHYFSNKPHSWFTPMQMMLREMNPGWSYAEGTAVQIDAVACATSRRFGDLDPGVKTRLQLNCQPYLTAILAGFAAGVRVVVNGSSAFAALGAAAQLVPNAGLSVALTKNPRIKMYVGEVRIMNKSLPYFGWNLYLHREPMNDAGAILDYWNSLPLRW